MQGEKNGHNSRKPERQHGVLFCLFCFKTNIQNKVVSTGDKRALSQNPNMDSGPGLPGGDRAI